MGMITLMRLSSSSSSQLCCISEYKKKPFPGARFMKVLKIITCLLFVCFANWTFGYKVFGL